MASARRQPLLAVPANFLGQAHQAADRPNQPPNLCFIGVHLWLYKSPHSAPGGGIGTRKIGPLAPVNRKLTVCLGGSLPSTNGGAGGAVN